MSEKRFTNVGGVEKSVHLVFDNETARTLSVKQTVKKLNEQESTITSLKERNKQLRRRLEKINGGYGHLPHKKGLTPNEWVIEAQEEELKNKDEMISEFIERHSEDIVKISELQASIEALREIKWKERKFLLDEKGIVEKISNKSYPRISSSEDDNPVKTLSCGNLFELVNLLNEQQNIINILLECLYVAEDTVINEYSSHIGEDMEKLEKIFKDRDIGEIRKFVLGVDEDESE